jgi:GNAT superfamily N-acetyltransferase
MTDYVGPEPIGSQHRTEDLACGEEDLDAYLRRYALTNDRSGGARTFVAVKKGSVVGFYSLVLGAVAPDEATARVSKGLGRYPIGVMILARLAVDAREQGQGLGQALLKDAMIRSVRVSKEAGVRALVAHAKNDRAKTWYETLGFEPSPTDPLHVMLLMKDIRSWLRDAGMQI